jgi:hypothetical protein
MRVYSTLKSVPGNLGPQGVGVASATINASGHLVLTMSNGNSVDAGSLYTAAAAPSNTALPTISSSDGTAFKVGATLTVNVGAWSGFPTSYSYGWLRDGEPIFGEEAATYVLTEGDATASIAATVQGINSFGSATATTATTPVISPAFTALRTFYFSAAGDDANDGLSAGSPKKTITAANALSLVAGDAVLFRGADTFSGSLVAQAGGSSSNRIYWGSYGGGRATISSGASRGFYGEDKAYITVRDLTFLGAGNNPSANVVEGILIQNTDGSNVKAGGPHIINNTVSLYGKNGIAPVGRFVSGGGSGKGWDGTIVGWNLVHDCTAGAADEKGNAGIMIYGRYPVPTYGYSHTNLLIERNVVRDCAGGANGTFSTAPHTGNGIVVGETDVGTVQYNHVEGCGEAGYTCVGIWSYEARAVVQQFNTAAYQKTTNGDGNGMGFDVGCVNCTIQFCYATLCEGAGIYAFAYEDSSVNACTGNTIRYNLAENNGTNSAHAGFNRGNFLWQNDSPSVKHECNWYNNTGYSSRTNGINFRIQQGSAALKGNIANNIFHAGSTTARWVYLDGFAPNTYTVGTSFVLLNNCYSGETTQPIFWLSNHLQVGAWLAGSDATDQERLSSVVKAITADARLSRTADAGVIEGYSPDDLTGYEVSSGSPAADGGLNLSTALSISPGATDFYGNSIPVGSGYSAGAHDRSALSTTSEAVIASTYSGSTVYSSGTGGAYVGASASSGAGLRDGTDNTNASVWASEVSDPYLIADCLASKTLTKVVVRPIGSAFDGWAATHLTSAKLDTSLDGVTWAHAGYIGLTVAGSDHTVSLGSVAGRYVRISRSGSADLALATFAVYGY